jgi:hypothetical protein
MNNLVIGFILGFIVATVGLGTFAKYVDQKAETAKVIIKENVK